MGDADPRRLERNHLNCDQSGYQEARRLKVDRRRNTDNLDFSWQNVSLFEHSHKVTSSSGKGFSVLFLKKTIYLLLSRLQVASTFDLLISLSAQTLVNFLML